MKKYFYTDPLAAAWMATHFKMMIVSQTNKPYRVSSLCTYAHISTQPKPIRFYIHPKSLYLLDPQVGDLMLDEHGTNAIRIVYPVTMYNLSDPIIIERDSIAFMWPEAEE